MFLIEEWTLGGCMFGDVVFFQPALNGALGDLWDDIVLQLR